jgi:hypothetical protein
MTLRELSMAWLATVAAAGCTHTTVAGPPPVDAWTDPDATMPGKLVTCTASVVRGEAYVDIEVGVQCTGPAPDTMAWTWDNVAGPIGIHREAIPCGTSITVRFPFDTALLHDTHVAATPLVSGGSLCVGAQL